MAYRGLVNVAKILTNPRTAVRTAFGLKTKPRLNAKYAGALVRRYYKKGIKAVPVQRTKVVNDGQGNQRMAINHGKQHKRLNKNLENKIRDALNPMSSQLIQRSGNVTTNTHGQGNFTVFELGNADDIDKVITSAAANSTGVSKEYNGKLHIANCKMDVMITNQASNLIHFRLYEYIYRNDPPETMEPYPGAGATISADTQNIVTYGFNYNAGSAVPPYVQTANQIGTTLFSNPYFCSYCKIIKVRNIQLGAGRSLKLTLLNNKDKVINPLVYYNSDSAAESGYTRGYVLQAMGSLLGGSGGDETVTTGLVSYDWVSIRKYQFNQPYDGKGHSYVDNTVPTIFSGSSSYMNPASQQAANEVVA